MQEIQETWVRFMGQKDPLEQNMATHSSLLACKILWTEEPGGMGPWVSKSWTQLSDYTCTCAPMIYSDISQENSGVSI